MSALYHQALDLARQLIGLNTVNPPGQEALAMAPLARLLEDAGFAVRLYDYAPRRPNLVAHLPGDGASLCLTGHLDTVPLGERQWSHDPFAGEIAEGRLYGRGSSDMKAGIAAMVTAAIAASQRRSRPGLSLVLTAGEETACAGAAALSRLPGVLGEAGAIIVGEPTNNRPMLGHRGVIWLEARFHGRTAHASMPEQGDNAILKAARAALNFTAHRFSGAVHSHLGQPSLNIGRIEGGANLNSVPDHATLGIDIRPLPGMDGATVIADLQAVAGGPCEIVILADVPGVWTAADEPWARAVFDTCRAVTGEPCGPAAVPFATDAAFLVPAYGNPPAVILGPGETEQAHQTDEYCRVDRLEQAIELYAELIDRWPSLAPSS